MQNTSDVSPLKGSMRGRGSPTSKRNNQQAQQQQQYNDANSLLHGLSEKEVEIESLKTIIVAQEEKIKVLASVREDLASARQLLAESEAARLQLQEQLRQNSEKTKEEAAKNHKFQETLILENKRLQSDIDRLKQDKSELEKDLG